MVNHFHLIFFLHTVRLHFNCQIKMLFHLLYKDIECGAKLNLIQIISKMTQKNTHTQKWFLGDSDIGWFIHATQQYRGWKNFRAFTVCVKQRENIGLKCSWKIMEGTTSYVPLNKRQNSNFIYCVWGFIVNAEEAYVWEGQTDSVTVIYTIKGRQQVVAPHKLTQNYSY